MSDTPIADKCRSTGAQWCTVCDDESCCDNLNQLAIRLRAALRDLEVVRVLADAAEGQRDAAIARAERAELRLSLLVEGCAEWEQREQVSLHDVPSIPEARAYVRGMRARVKA